MTTSKASAEALQGLADRTSGLVAMLYLLKGSVIQMAGVLIIMAAFLHNPAQSFFTGTTVGNGDERTFVPLYRAAVTGPSMLSRGPGKRSPRMRKTQVVIFAVGISTPQNRFMIKYASGAKKAARMFQTLPSSMGARPFVNGKKAPPQPPTKPQSKGAANALG
eukprot:CAMPEP_0203857556 /NCGR_PEP_ID=MMETSP0359-20131031/10796_1 /ASSEMBLY_ACC=CAM_ASM_000338 /TAXON_ID=268821 /ORGANISM="Scrippsiella Hangoei, Strain SHTV-5" /LENGTH=162 /DNA_ID=CAMNT_0050774267 /DNA_START=9 /DNA_END=494 /DNA_ORIENTATION=-